MKELTLFDMGMPEVEEKETVKKESKTGSKKEQKVASSGKAEKVAAAAPKKKVEVKVIGEWHIHFATESFLVSDFVEEIPEEGVTLEEVRAEMERHFAQFSAARTKWDVDEENLRLFPDAFAGSKGGSSLLRAPFYLSIDESVDKSLSYIPSSNGKVFEVRNSIIGQMVTPVDSISYLNEIEEGFTFGLPKISNEILGNILAFFKKFATRGNYEVMVRVHFDLTTKEYVMECPEQRVSPISIDCIYDIAFTGRNSLRYIPVLEIHSHNVMPAFFSSTDDEDEQRYGLYAVVGKLDTDSPQILIRAKANNSAVPVAARDIFHLNNLESFTEYPAEWDQMVTIRGEF